MNTHRSFGQIVRERRGALGLTQSELARRVSCAPITIRKIEADMLRPSVQLAELLAAKLKIPAAEQKAFVRLARQERPFTPLPKPTPSPTEIGLDDLTGHTIKAFTIAERIGSGGYGVVYRAVQQTVQRDVAIKIILPHFANHPVFIRRFEAEAQLIAQLEHPHIVPLYDYWREPGVAFLIMRLLQNDLSTTIQSGPLAVETVWQISQQIGAALASAHSRSIIHQDIKPANVLLDADQNAYLADFGIAIHSLPTDTPQTATADKLTTGLAYTAPEKLRDEPVGQAADIYSFGLLLYEMVTGKAAYEGATPHTLRQQQLNQPVPSLTPELPPALDALIQKATAKRADQRHPTINALLAELEMVLHPSAIEVGSQTAVSAPLSADHLRQLTNPYQGLHPFPESAADRFFGRETWVQELLDKLADPSELNRLLAIVGPSGSGKSSLINAGLLPALRQGRLPGAQNWYIVTLTPGQDPWEAVAGALQRVASQPVPGLRDLLHHHPLGLLEATRQLLPDDEAIELLLVIDQFEELFTLTADSHLVIEFLDSLTTAVLSPDARLNVVLTLRADFLDRPLQHVDFGELLRQRMMLVTPLTPDELTQAIIKPLQPINMHMTPDLMATIIQDMSNQPGMLPLLQYALTELFEQRQSATLDLTAYQAIGGVSGALARRAETLYANLDEAGQEATRQLFLRLITLGEGSEDTRRRVLISELQSLRVSETNTVVARVIDQYGRYRLLTFDHDPVTRGPTVEVAHEALIREWPRLRTWLRESREDVRRQRLLAQAAAQWRQNDRDDSYLLRGSRLTSFAAWMETSTVTLTAVEQTFLQTSIDAQEARHTAEEARRQRELETARRLAEEQRQRAAEQTRSAQRLRQFSIGLAGALFVVAALAVVSALFARASAANEQLARESYSLSLAANARQALEGNNQPLALLLALAANGVEDPPPAAWQTLLDIAQAPGVTQQLYHDSPVNSVAVSPNGRFLLTGADDGRVRVWDRQSGQVVQTLAGHKAAVSAVAFSANGRYLLSGGADHLVLLWDRDSGQLLHQLSGHKGPISGVAFTPDSQHAVTAEDTAASPSDLIVWDVQTGEVVNQFGGSADGNTEGMLDMALDPTGRLALVGQRSFDSNNPQEAILWDINTSTPVQIFSVANRTVSSVAIGPNGRFALTAGEDGTVYRWDTATGELTQQLTGHEGDVLALAVSPNGQTALSASLDQTLIWWDLQTGKPIQQFASGTGEIHSLRFVDNRQAVTADTDGMMQIWDLTSGWQLARWGEDGSGHLPPAPGTENRGMGVAIAPNGRFALSGGNEPDYDLLMWSYETGEIIRRMRSDSGNIFAIAITPDSQQAITAMQDGSLIVWDLTTGEPVRQLVGHQGSVNSVALTADGQRAISASLGGGVIYWEVATGEILQRMIGHFEGRGAYDVTFLPGEQQAVSSAWDGTMIVWDLATGEQIRRLTGLNGGAGSHFSADGDWGIHGISVDANGRLLSAGRDESLLLWDVPSGSSVRRFVGHAGFVVDVAFSPDGQTAVSTAENDAVIVWDVATGTVLRRLPLNNRLNSAFRPTLAMHPDGRSLLVTDADGTLIKWQMAEPTPAELAAWLTEHRALRELSCVERETYGIEPLCVADVAQAPTSDLLLAVATAQPAILPSTTLNEPPPVDLFTSGESAGQEAGTAVLGQNRGELTPHRFDVWTYDGTAGEVLQFEMVADSPLADSNLPLAERNDAGLLDTLLFLIAPDGTLLTKANDGQSQVGAYQSDADIVAFMLPEDGMYRIEARSFLDEGAGNYTLHIRSREYVMDLATLKEYEGHFLEGPYEYDMIHFVENGRLQVEIIQVAQTLALIPIEKDTFIASDGSITAFKRDETGEIVGYDVWLSLIHPIGGQWIEAVKLDD